MVTVQPTGRENEDKATPLMQLRHFGEAIKNMQLDIEKAYKAPHFPVDRDKLERIHTQAIIQLCQF